MFLSHKHDELDELKDIIGFLERYYNVKTYIDSRDPSMPLVTSGATASRIKERINECDRFILIATNGAIDSKWCNWELGFGDALKYSKKHIALLPFKETVQAENQYRGNEYMEIYPYIVFRGNGDKYSDGSLIPPGFYVRYKNENGRYSLKPLEEWFK